MAGVSSSHADLQFETAMPYADSSFPFIGDIVFSDDTRERILEKATEIFRDSETNPILTAKDKATSRLVFTATVLAAKKWEKDEDGLYDYLARTFNCEDNPPRLRNIITCSLPEREAELSNVKEDTLGETNILNSIVLARRCTEREAVLLLRTDSDTVIPQE